MRKIIIPLFLFTSLLAISSCSSDTTTDNSKDPEGTPPPIDNPEYNSDYVVMENNPNINNKTFGTDEYGKINKIEKIEEPTDTVILHDTPKQGSVEFKVVEGTTGTTFSWTITGPDNYNKKGTGESYKATDLKAGKYNVTLDIDGTKHNGVIDIPGDISKIPNNQKYYIDLGPTHTVIADNSHTMFYMYGKNDKGQLCLPSSKASLVYPENYGGFNKVTSVGTGSNHTMFVSNNIVYGCGDNSKGQLGDNTNNQANTPVVAKNLYLKDIKNAYVTAGGEMTTVIIENNDYANLYTIGYDDINKNNKLPRKIGMHSKLNSFSVNEHFSFPTGNNFSVTRGSAYVSLTSYGVNDKWQLGRTAHPEDVALEAMRSWKYDNLLNFNPDKNLDKNKTDMFNSTVWAPYGEDLIDSSSDDFYVQQNSNFTRPYFQNYYYTRIATGDDFTVSIKRETMQDYNYNREDRYAVYVWGGNDKGQLGFETQEAKNSNNSVRRPTAIFEASGLKYKKDTNPYGKDPNKVKPVLATIVEVAAGSAHGLALDDKGQLYGWGNNDSKQLTNSPTAYETFNEKNASSGTNKAKIFTLPNPASVVDGYTMIWAGGNRSIALAKDGNLYTWGDNTNKILGVNSKEANVDTPTKLFFKIKSK